MMIVIIIIYFKCHYLPTYYLQAGFSYGNIPNNPATWDATRIFGCLCDPQYTGYDCSLLTCPYGDDPDTPNQVDEQQIISCTYAGGSDAQVFIVHFILRCE